MRRIATSFLATLLVSAAAAAHPVVMAHPMVEPMAHVSEPAAPHGAETEPVTSPRSSGEETTPPYNPALYTPHVAPQRATGDETMPADADGNAMDADDGKPMAQEAVEPLGSNSGDYIDEAANAYDTVANAAQPDETGHRDWKKIGLAIVGVLGTLGVIALLVAWFSGGNSSDNGYRDDWGD